MIPGFRFQIGFGLLRLRSRKYTFISSGVIEKSAHILICSILNGLFGSAPRVAVKMKHEQRGEGGETVRNTADDMDHAKALSTVASNGRSLANVGEHRSSESVCLAAVQNWGLARPSPGSQPRQQRSEMARTVR